MESLTIRGVNEPPAPTWNHLEINGIDLDLPAAPGFDGNAWGHAAEADGGELTEAQAAPRESGRSFDIPEDMPAAAGPWAHRSDGEGASGVVAGGMGVAVDAWIEAASANRLHVGAQPGSRTAATEVIDLAQVGSVVVVDVEVEAGASQRVVLVAGDDVFNDDDRHASASCEGVRTAGWFVRVSAKEDAHVEIVEFVAPGHNVQMLDDVGVSLARGAHVKVSQYHLGSQILASGLAADLVGDRSQFEVDCRYVGRGTQRLDLAYAIRNRGRKSVSKLTGRGVLADAANKSMRMTADLVHGAKGASAEENESVVLAGDNVVNKSLPTILCNEDDVAGSHGASIGEVGADQLVYLISRGLTADEARSLILEATYEVALNQAREIEPAFRAVQHAAEDALGKDVVAELSSAR